MSRRLFDAQNIIAPNPVRRRLPLPSHSLSSTHHPSPPLANLRQDGRRGGLRRALRSTELPYAAVSAVPGDLQGGGAAEGHVGGLEIGSLRPHQGRHPVRGRMVGCGEQALRRLLRGRSLLLFWSRSSLLLSTTFW